MKPVPTLRQLRYLVAVAEHRHFGRAADDCFVTQSTLSAGIRELETVLGVTLIGRTKRSVELTPLGEDIVLRAQAILSAADELVEAAQAGEEPLAGLVRLGVIPTIAPYLLPRVLGYLRAAYPRLRLYLREEQTGRLLDLVGRSRLDGAIIALPYEVGPLEVVKLGEDPLLVACPADHPLAARSSVREADLQGQPLLLLEDGHCLRDHALTACRLLPGQANEEFQATSMSTLVQMVASGLGITLLPRLAVDIELRREAGVRAVPIAGGRPSREIALCWRRGASRERDLTLLAQVLKPALAAPAPAALAEPVP
jgi:LysR family hydrogen peroxide-inducible transcriptional activator